MQVRSFWIENIIFYTQILNFLRHTHMFRMKWNHYNNIQCSRKNLYVHKSPAPSHQTFSVSQIHSFHNSSFSQLSSYMSYKLNRCTYRFSTSYATGKSAELISDSTACQIHQQDRLCVRSIAIKARQMEVRSCLIGNWIGYLNLLVFWSIVLISKLGCSNFLNRRWSQLFFFLKSF